jgi:hypothetical protein
MNEDMTGKTRSSAGRVRVSGGCGPPARPARSRLKASARPWWRGARPSPCSPRRPDPAAGRGRRPFQGRLVGELSTHSADFSHPLGRPQRPLPRHRHEGPPPPRRRRPHPHLQPHGARRRRRADAHDLDRGTLIQVRTGAYPARKLGRGASTVGDTRRPRSSLARRAPPRVSNRSGGPRRRLAPAVLLPIEKLS